MTQYNSFNVKLSNLQLNELKSAMKNETEAVLRLSSNMIDNPNDETNLLHKLLSTNHLLVDNIKLAFPNKSSTDIKLSKTQLSKLMQSGGFLGRILGPLLRTGLSLMKNVIQPLAKGVLIPLELIAAASAADAEIHKNILEPGTTTLIIFNDETEDIIKIVKSLEVSGLLLKGVGETIENEAKEQKGGFLSMLLGTLGESLSGNI